MIINKGMEKAEEEALRKYRDPVTGKLKSFGVKFEDFYAFRQTHTYIFAPTGEHWPASSVDAELPREVVTGADGTPMMETKGKNKGKPVTIPAHVALDQRRAVQGITWAPGEPQHVNHRVFTKGGWVERPGLTTYNEYRPPNIAKGNPAGAQRWIDLLTKLYPDDVAHFTAYCAHRIQKPGEKINHAILLAGAPGIGKDTLLEPLVYGVGADNFKEASPQDIMGQWSDFMCAVVLRISEARDLGEFDRYKFHEKTKTLFAAPPHTHRINIKFKPQYYPLRQGISSRLIAIYCTAIAKRSPMPITATVSWPPMASWSRANRVRGCRYRRKPTKQLQF